MYWNEYKTNEYRYFLESNFIGVKRLFVLIDSHQVTMLKGINPGDIIYQKVLLRIITSAT